MNNEDLVETPKEQDDELLGAELSPGRQQLLEELKDARTLYEAVKGGK